MRLLLLSLAVLAASASPAPAQTDRDAAARQQQAQIQAQIQRDAEARQQALTAEQQMQAQRAVELENRLNSLDARVQSEERLRGLQTMRTPTPPPVLSADDLAVEKSEQASAYATIPDAMLADSNARVRAVVQNKR